VKTPDVALGGTREFNAPAVLGDVRGSGRVGLGAGVARYPGHTRMFAYPGQSALVAIDRDHVPGVGQALADRAADPTGCACDHAGLRHLIRAIASRMASAGRLLALICRPEAGGTSQAKAAAAPPPRANSTELRPWTRVRLSFDD
jgi:hypothetical protein